MGEIVSEIIVRFAEESDSSSIETMVNKSRIVTTNDVYPQKLDFDMNRELLFVATENKAIVGFCRFVFESGVVNQLCVQSSMQNTEDVVSELMEAVESTASNHRCSSIIIACDKTTEDFFKTLGFQRDEKSESLYKPVEAQAVNLSVA